MTDAEGEAFAALLDTELDEAVRQTDAVRMRSFPHRGRCAVGTQDNKREATMTALVCLPGIYDSGPAHWQTLWEAADPSIVRFAPSDWDEPRVDDWVSALDAVVGAAGGPPVLIAHSLACLLVPIWAARSSLPAAGALLVAPTDPQGAAFPVAALEFADFPRAPLRFPALVVGSLNDHYATAEWVHGYAHDLGADFVVAGALGHINADSGLGDWEQGRGLLDAFCASLS